MFELSEHTIFLTLAGSQAQGTAREGSDVDVRGVCIAPMSVRLSLYDEFRQVEGELSPELFERVKPRMLAHKTASKGLGVKVESAIFDVARFVELCAQANPSALEILFTDERDWLLETAAWRRLHNTRHHFVTLKVQQTFEGYAMAQLRRIKSHRGWLLSPPQKKPDRQDFGLPLSGGTLSRDDMNRVEKQIEDRIRSYGIDDLEMPKALRLELHERLSRFYQDAILHSEGSRAEGGDTGASDKVKKNMRVAAARSLGVPADVMSTLNAEKKFRAAMKHWRAYKSWKQNRNPMRAELERTHGYDTKHAMHLIRLMRMGLEALKTGEIVVRRSDAEELLAIRDGALSFEQLQKLAGELRAEMNQRTETAALPADVDRDFVDALVFEIAHGGQTP